MKEQHPHLDTKMIISAISPENRSFIDRLEVFDSLESTNTYLLDQLKKVLTPQSRGTWACFAEQQTLGRGRQGKSWYSPPANNLYFSLTWIFPSPFAGLSALSLVCAVMIIQGLHKFGLDQGLSLKWPNDILFSGRKLGGILIENLVSAQENRVVIGIGLNLFLPAEKKSQWACVSEVLPSPIARNQLAGLVLNELLSGIKVFEQQGLNPFLPQLFHLDYLRGQAVQILTAQATIQGTAQGINEAGELMILDADGKIQTYCYGEVSLRALKSLG